jgi:transposase
LRLLYGVLCLGGFQLAVSHTAPTGELLTAPFLKGKEQPSQRLNEYGVGVDCHSGFFQICVLIPNDRELKKVEQKVPALWSALRAAQAWVLHTLREQGIEVAPSELRYTCESTGQYHMPLCLAWGGRPSVINPSDTGHIRRKTDRLDAQKLAQHSLNGLWRESWMAPDWIQELRVLAIQRGKLVGERSRLSNRINGDMLRFGHTIGQVGKINGSVVRPLIEDFCRNGTVRLHREFFSDVAIPPGVSLVFDQRWKRIDEINREIKTIEEACVNHVNSKEWCIGGGQRVRGSELTKNLQSIPGVGMWTAIIWLAEVGDILRFATLNRLIAYAGLDPSGEISAGKVVNNKVRKGNARLHYSLRNAARAMLTHAPSSQFSVWARAYIARQSRGAKSKAIHALARRVCKAMYYCHLKNQPFDESKYATLLSESSYPDCPVEEMGLSAGVVRILKGNGLNTSRQVVDAFYSDLGRRPGCGRVTVQAVATWINIQRSKRRDKTRSAGAPISSTADCRED